MSGLREYRFGLIRQARRFNDFPPSGRSSGSAGIRITVAAGGRFPRVDLLSSSGNSDLDQQLIILFRKATDATPVPASLQYSDFVLDLSILIEPFQSD